MVYGAIDQNNRPIYTYISQVFAAIHGEQKNYNWLITDSECYPKSENLQKLLYTRQFFIHNEDGTFLHYERPEYNFLSGEELTAVIQEEDFQWIWGVFSGFDKDIPLDEILTYPLPEADGYGGFWKNPLSLQHPLATVEIVPWDSALTLFLSTRKDLVDRFMAETPGCRDLAEYNLEP